MKPYTPKQQDGKVPLGCSKCKAAFKPEAWPRSKWTLNGFSPWCPTCHEDFAGDDWNRFNNRRKPGPKPKRQEEPNEEL
jgi:hypothetical protein